METPMLYVPTQYHTPGPRQALAGSSPEKTVPHRQPRDCATHTTPPVYRRPFSDHELVAFRYVSKFKQYFKNGVSLVSPRVNQRGADKALQQSGRHEAHTPSSSCSRRPSQDSPSRCKKRCKHAPPAAETLFENEGDRVLTKAEMEAEVRERFGGDVREAKDAFLGRRRRRRQHQHQQEPAKSRRRTNSTVETTSTGPYDLYISTPTVRPTGFAQPTSYFSYYGDGAPTARSSRAMASDVYNAPRPHHDRYTSQDMEGSHRRSTSSSISHPSSRTASRVDGYDAPRPRHDRYTSQDTAGSRRRSTSSSTSHPSSRTRVMAGDVYGTSSRPRDDRHTDIQPTTSRRRSTSSGRSTTSYGYSSPATDHYVSQAFAGSRRRSVSGSSTPAPSSSSSSSTRPAKRSASSHDNVDLYLYSHYDDDRMGSPPSHRPSTRPRRSTTNTNRPAAGPSSFTTLLPGEDEPQVRPRHFIRSPMTASSLAWTMLGYIFSTFSPPTAPSHRRSSRTTRAAAATTAPRRSSSLAHEHPDPCLAPATSSRRRTRHSARQHRATTGTSSTSIMSSSMSDVTLIRRPSSPSRAIAQPSSTVQPDIPRTPDLPVQQAEEHGIDRVITARAYVPYASSHLPVQQAEEDDADGLSLKTSISNSYGEVTTERIITARAYVRRASPDLPVQQAEEHGIEERIITARAYVPCASSDLPVQQAEEDDADGLSLETSLSNSYGDVTVVDEEDAEEYADAEEVVVVEEEESQYASAQEMEETDVEFASAVEEHSSEEVEEEATSAAEEAEAEADEEEVVVVEHEATCSEPCWLSGADMETRTDLLLLSAKQGREAMARLAKARKGGMGQQQQGEEAEEAEEDAITPFTEREVVDASPRATRANTQQDRCPVESKADFLDFEPQVDKLLLAAKEGRAAMSRLARARAVVEATEEAADEGVVIKGYMLKESSGRLVKRWQRRFFFIRDGALSYTHTEAEADRYLQDGTGRAVKVCKLLTTRARVDSSNGEEEDVIITLARTGPPPASPIGHSAFWGRAKQAGRGMTYKLKAESAAEASRWVQAINNFAEEHIVSSAGEGAARSMAVDMTALCTSSPTCADCGAASPGWASMGFGVLVCDQCSGVHRGLGVHITQVKSLTLDLWSKNEVEAISRLEGNTAINSILEANVPAGRCKPGAKGVSAKDRKEWILAKYIEEAFLPVDAGEEEAL